TSVPSSYELQEVAQDAEADVAGFLRMKLHAGDVATLHDGGERLPVIGDGDGVAVDGRGVAVREVHLRAGRDALHNRRGLRQCQAVPTDVRHLEVATIVRSVRRQPDRDLITIVGSVRLQPERAESVT